MKHVVRLLALGAILAGAGASAQTAAFDMKGTWKGTGEAIVDGHGTHHPAGSTAKPAGPYRLRELHFTYKIDGHEGKRFWGTVSSEHEANQRMIGSLSADGKWIYTAARTASSTAPWSIRTPSRCAIARCRWRLRSWPVTR